MLVSLIAVAGCDEGESTSLLNGETHAESLLSPCAESGPRSELQCGRLRVREEPDNPAGRTIELNVVVAPAKNATAKTAGLFILEGGPGVPATGNAEFFLNEGAAYRDRHDVVMVDLRGTGGSNPLHCAQRTGDDLSLQRYVSEMYPVDEVTDCRALLETKADLRHYATANAVEDLEVVRQALGYPKIDLQGISYGTRLATQYARRYPNHVRTLTAIGSLPPEHRMPLQHAAGFERAFDMLLTDCEGDAACSTAFPNLRDDWLSLLQRMAEPVIYRHKGTDLSIRREIFVEELRSAMYFATRARTLPSIVDAASRGDFGPFVELAVPDDPDAPAYLARGAYLSFTCTDDVARIAEGDIALWNDGTYLGDYRVSQQTRACELWPKGPFPAAIESELEVDVPSLLVTGERDPVTPPSDAEQMARWLPNSRVVIVPHAGHMPFDGSDPECVDRVLQEFLKSASIDDLDLSCVNANKPPPFAVN